MSIEIKSYVEGHELLQAVRKLAADFRTGKDLPSLQRDQVAKAQ